MHELAGPRSGRTMPLGRLSSRASLALRLACCALASFLLAPHLYADEDIFVRLEGGRHLSVLPHGYFEDPAALSEPALDALLDASISRGNTSASYELDWSEIEVEEEVYDVEGFRAQILDWKARGLENFYLNVSAISIDTLGAPADLIDPEDPDRFRDALLIDDPLIISRYQKMLDAILPVFIEEGGFAFSAGNEIDGYFEKYPESADNFVNFLRAVREHVRSYSSEIPVGVILTSAAALDDQPWHVPILRESDFAGYNFYAIEANVLTVVRDEATIRARLRELVRDARGLPILIQEFGVPVRLDGMSEEEQAEITRIMYEEVYDHPRVRWISWFKMTDFSQLFADSWGALLLAAGESPEFVDTFKDWLRGLGLAAYETGEARLAWSDFLHALDRVALDVETLRFEDEESLAWGAPERATAFDVSRGELDALRIAGGLADALALACGRPEARLQDPERPPSGAGFYYLVRALGVDASGSWGRAKRDRDVTACALP